MVSKNGHSHGFNRGFSWFQPWFPLVFRGFPWFQPWFQPCFLHGWHGSSAKRWAEPSCPSEPLPKPQTSPEAKSTREWSAPQAACDRPWVPPLQKLGWLQKETSAKTEGKPKGSNSLLPSICFFAPPGKDQELFSVVIDSNFKTKRGKQQK